MSLPRWLAGLPDAERMRAIDRWAIEQLGVPSADLMERAGASLDPNCASYARMCEELFDIARPPAPEGAGRQVLTRSASA